MASEYDTADKVEGGNNEIKTIEVSHLNISVESAENHIVNFNKCKISRQLSLYFPNELRRVQEPKCNPKFRS